MVVKMIFFILFQLLPDTLESPGKLVLGYESYPQELIEVFDSIYFGILSSADTNSALWEYYFGNSLKDALWNNERLRNYAVKNYVERGEQVFFLPFFRSPIWDELQRKRIEFLNSKKIEKVKDYIFKKRLEEYYKHKDDLSILYEKIPEEMAIDEDFVYIGTHFYMGGIFWFNKVGEKWFVNILDKINPEGGLFTGYFNLLENHTDTTTSLFLLSRDSLRQMPSDSFYYIYHYSLEEDTWVVGFHYNREKNLWHLYPIFLPLYFDANCPPYLNHDIYTINKNSELFSFLSKSLSKIEEITDINSDSRIGYYSFGEDYFVWWITDEFSEHSYEKVKVKFFFFYNIIHSDIHQLFSFPGEDFLSKPINLRRKRIEKVNIEGETGTKKVLDSVTVYYRLPWVNKPEIKLIDGILFLVKPTGNPIYRTVHGFHVIGLTLRNTCLKSCGKGFENINLFFVS